MSLNLSDAYYSVTTVFQVARPTTMDFNEPLVASSLINDENPIALPPKEDTIDMSGVEELRRTWIEALDRKAIDPNEAPKDVESLVHSVLQKMAAGEDNALMKSLIEDAQVPVPPDYELALPMIDISDRKAIIDALVPFKETKAMLLRLEDVFELPMRIVRVISGRMDGLIMPEGPSLLH